MNGDRIPEIRELSERERVFLEWLLENGGPDSRTFLPSISDVRVASRCSCGCPTIDLQVAGAQAKTSAPSQIVADFIGVTPEGVDVGVILHVREGVLSELEIYALGDSEGSFSLPDAKTLKPL